MNGMKNISLLPPEIKAQARMQQQQRHFILGGSLVFLICFGVFSVLFIMTMQAESRLKILQEQRMTIESRNEGYQQYAKLQTRIQSAEGMVQRAVGKSPDWVQLLGDINRCLPPNVWMTDFRASHSAELQLDKDKKVAVSPQGVFIQGWSSDYSAVVLWLEGLYNLKFLSNVSCRYTGQQTFENQTRVNFEITATILPEAIPRSTGTGGS